VHLQRPLPAAHAFVRSAPRPILISVNGGFSQEAPDGGRRDPHLADVAAAVRELAMSADNIPPALKHLNGRGDLLQDADRGRRRRRRAGGSEVVWRHFLPSAARIAS
jgi:hypothetical protein